MAKVIIAYDDDTSNVSRRFMESCADTAKQYCVGNNHFYTLMAPPNLNNANVVSILCSHHVCMIAAHGAAHGVYNEIGNDIVSTKTDNYGFMSKCFYSVSCYCAKELKPELQRLGLKIFIGYDDIFYVGQDEDVFVECAMEGLKCLLQGDSVCVSKRKMLCKYNDIINATPFPDNTYLLQNREHLVFEGHCNMTIADLE